MGEWNWQAISNLLAIALSPVVAVLVTLWLQNRIARRRSKMEVFSVLVSNRHKPIHDENVRALHLIDTVFAGDTLVRELWHKYFDLLGSSDGTGEIGSRKREQTYRDMLVRMARVLGYRWSIEQGDIERIYTPTGLSEQARVQEETAREFLRVLRASESFGGFRAQAPTTNVELEGKPSAVGGLAPSPGAAPAASR